MNKWWKKKETLTKWSWLMSKFKRCKCKNRCRCKTWTLECKWVWIKCRLKSSKLTNSRYMSNSKTKHTSSRWWLPTMVDTLNLWGKMGCQSARSNTMLCWLLNRNMEMKWSSMEKRTWLISNINKKTLLRRIQFKTKFKRLSRFVLTTMLCLEIQSSPLMIHLCITTLSSLQSTPWTCQW